jgi:predicted transcriptional regulator
MSTTITVRADGLLRKRLEERAAATGKSLSALVREILEGAVADRPLCRRAGHLKGRLVLPGDRTDAWRDELHARNWRP